MKYKIGDRVRIVSNKRNIASWNNEGKMDKWLGQIMTIRDIVDSRFYKMVEDKNETNCNSTPGWNWSESMIECLEPEDVELNDPCGDTVLNEFLCKYSKIGG